MTMRKSDMGDRNGALERLQHAVDHDRPFLCNPSEAWMLTQIIADLRAEVVRLRIPADVTAQVDTTELEAAYNALVADPEYGNPAQALIDDLVTEHERSIHDFVDMTPYVWQTDRRKRP